jgi:hypothetical protein
VNLPGGMKVIGVGMFKYPSLMGIFPLPTPDTTNIALINMISYVVSTSLGSYDPWVLPHPSEVDSYGATMPLSPVELSYSVI